MQKAMIVVSIESTHIVGICVTRRAKRIINFVNQNVLADACAGRVMQNPIC